MKKVTVAIGVVVALMALPALGSAAAIATTDATEIAAFQAGATVITFEGISGVTAFNNQTPGTVVPGAALLKNQIAGLTFFSNAGEGPAVLDLSTFANLSDAVSPPNILAGTAPDGPSGEAVICFTCFIEVTFASPVSRVGAFNDPTGGLIQLLATDLSGSTIFETVLANRGEFVGADTGINNIARALFLFIAPQSVNGFSLDDLTFARAGTTAVPEPGTLILLAGGLGGLAWLGRRGR